jgi:hypothetical protein
MMFDQQLQECPEPDEFRIEDGADGQDRTDVVAGSNPLA